MLTFSWLDQQADLVRRNRVRVYQFLFASDPRILTVSFIINSWEGLRLTQSLACA